MAIFVLLDKKTAYNFKNYWSDFDAIYTVMCLNCFYTKTKISKINLIYKITLIYKN